MPKPWPDACCHNEIYLPVVPGFVAAPYAGCPCSTASSFDAPGRSPTSAKPIPVVMVTINSISEKPGLFPGLLLGLFSSGWWRNIGMTCRQRNDFECQSTDGGTINFAHSNRSPGHCHGDHGGPSQPTSVNGWRPWVGSNARSTLNVDHRHHQSDPPVNRAPGKISNSSLLGCHFSPPTPARCIIQGGQDFHFIGQFINGQLVAARSCQSRPLRTAKGATSVIRLISSMADTSNSVIVEPCGGELDIAKIANNADVADIADDRFELNIEFA